MNSAELLPYALLGSERREPSRETLQQATAGLIGSAGRPENAAELLLTAASVATSAERAARRLSAFTADPLDEAPAEIRPECTGVIASRLDQVLESERAGVRREFFTLLDAAGMRAPHDRLPAVLNALRGDAEIRTAAGGSLGRRAEWLARLNPGWNFVHASAETLDEAAWETGARAARQRYLELLRDREPPRARALLQEAWPRESADVRASLLEVLRVRLSADDEPFLESLLQDRARSVREAAATLLALAPSETFAARMRSLLQPLVVFVPKKGLFGSAQLTVELPVEYSAEMRLAGIEPKPDAAHKEFGERSWLLIQLLRWVPPSVWSQEYRLKPAELLRLAEKTDHAATLRAGWGHAARLHRDSLWCEALLDSIPFGTPHYLETLGCVPRTVHEEIIRQRLNAPLHPDRAREVSLLTRALPAPWSAPITRSLLQWARGAVERLQPHEFAWELPNWGPAVDPYADPKVEAGWSEKAMEPANNRAWIEKFVETVRFRREMIEEFRR